MFLTASNLYFYLRDTGLASPSDIVDGDYGLSEIGRRNRNFRVVGTGERAIFVKQVPAVISETVLSFLREAACAQLAAEAPPAGVLHNAGATLRRYDAKSHILVYDAFEVVESLSEFALRRGGAALQPIAERLALMLASIHGETMQSGALARVSSVMTGDVPWVFIIAKDAETVMPNMSGGCRQIVGYLRQMPELSGPLEQFGRQWRRLCLMHGDMKSENVVIVTRPDGREIKIIDWELANLGDPLWDAAGALCLFLQQWLFTIRVDGTAPAIGSVPGDAGALAAAKANAEAFWTTYLGRMRSVLPADDDATLRVGRLTAARLVLLVFELLPNAAAVTPHAMIALQLARYLAVDTARALKDLLGITASSSVAAGGPRPAAPAEPWKLPAEQA